MLLFYFVFVDVTALIHDGERVSFQLCYPCIFFSFSFFTATDALISSKVNTHMHIQTKPHNATDTNHNHNPTTLQPHNHRKQPRSAICQRVHENILLFRTQRITSQYDFPELCQREEEQGLFSLSFYPSLVSLWPLFPFCFFPSPLLLCLFFFPLLPFSLFLSSSFPSLSNSSPLPLSPFPFVVFPIPPLSLSSSPPFPFSYLLYLPLLLLTSSSPPT